MRDEREPCTKPKCRNRVYDDGLCARHWNARARAELREQRRAQPAPRSRGVATTTKRETMSSTQTAVEERNGVIVVTDSRVDPSTLILEGIDTSSGPVFSVGEVGRFFFARTSHWMRWVEREGKLVIDGQAVAQDRSDAGSRKYTLSDVEQAAHALAANGAISGTQLRLALSLVAIQAELHGYK